MPARMFVVLFWQIKQICKKDARACFGKPVNYSHNNSEGSRTLIIRAVIPKKREFYSALTTPLLITLPRGTSVLRFYKNDIPCINHGLLSYWFINW